MARKKKQTRKIDWRIVIAGIFAITILELYAMYQGMNGTLLKAVMVVIAGLAGYTLQLRTR